VIEVETISSEYLTKHHLDLVHCKVLADAVSENETWKFLKC